MNQEIKKIAFLDTQKKYLIQEIDKLKTHNVFGEWKNISYGEKQLVNAVLDTVKKIITR